MIECYSKEVAVANGVAIPLNNTALKKGTTVERTGASTIQFNSCGIYAVTVNVDAIPSDAPVSPATTSEVSIQLSKNGVLQPQAESSITLEENAKGHLAFTTLVQVPVNNSNCPCSSPTICTIQNTGVASTFDIDVVVTKIV